MKKIFKQLAAASLAAALITAGNAALPAATGIPSASAAETGIVTIDESGKCGEYDYTYWSDGYGTIDTQFREDGGFDFVWNDVSSALCTSGRNFEENEMTGEPVIEYKASADGGKYTFGAECFFKINDSLLIDFCIVDDWGGVEREETYPSSSAALKLLTTLETDGGVYDMYKYNVTGFVDGTGQNIVKILSVRREKTSAATGTAEGKISVYKHIAACKEAGVRLNSPVMVAFLAEAWSSSGSAHVEKNKLSFNGEENISETASEVNSRLRGDANLDDQVNIADAVLVMQVASDPDKSAQGRSEFSIKPQGELNADVDGKKGLTNEDALMIQQFKLGLIGEFPRR